MKMWIERRPNHFIRTDSIIGMEFKKDTSNRDYVEVLYMAPNGRPLSDKCYEENLIQEYKSFIKNCNEKTKNIDPPQIQETEPQVFGCISSKNDEDDDEEEEEDRKK